MNVQFWFSKEHAKHYDRMRGTGYDKPFYCTAIVNGKRVPYTACGPVGDREPYNRARIIFPDYQSIGVGDDCTITAEDRNYFEEANNG